MTARWANTDPGRTCTKCGVHVDGGRIFCTNCGVVLQTPMPLIQLASEDYSPPSRDMSPAKGTIARSILLGFPLCVLLDIVLGILIPDHVMNVVLVVMTSILFFGSLLVAFGTVTRNRWGINTKPVNCPTCGAAMPRLRRPKSLTQALWAGGTCGKCGCEMDKWGRFTTLKRIS
jgi:hypothetical protein